MGKSLKSTGEPDFRALVEKAPVPFLVLAPEEGFAILAASEAYLRVARMPRDEVVGRALFDLLREDPTQPGGSGLCDLRASLQRVLRFQKPDATAFQTRGLRLSGEAEGAFEERRWEAVNTPIFDEGGGVQAIFHVVEGGGRVQPGVAVTEKDAARRAIENERENFRNLFRQTPEMVCILSGPEHVFEFVNEAHIRALGFDATGMTVRAAQPESVEVHGILDEVYRTGKTAQLHEIEVTLTQRRRVFNLTYAARWDEQGSINGIMILGVEVTEQVLAREDLKRSEEQLRATAQNLEEAVRARDEFLVVASHEFKTPLHSLQLQVELAARAMRGLAAPISERLSPIFESVRKQADRLTTLSNTLLDWSALRSGQLPLTLGCFDLSRLTKELAEQFAGDLARSGCELRLDLRPGATAQVDPARVDQILSSLLSNAVKYGPGKPITISVSMADGVVSVSVQDQGMGVASEDLSRIFEKFERAVPAEGYGGLGLGLYIGRQLAESMGGSLAATSSPVAGSNFILRFPHVPAPTPELP